MSTGDDRKIILDTNGAVSAFRRDLAPFGISGPDFEEMIKQIIDPLLGDFASYDKLLLEVPELYRIGATINEAHLPQIKERVQCFGQNFKAYICALGIPRVGPDGLVEFDFYYDCLLNEDIILRAFPY